MLYLMERHVNIGINALACPTKRTGVLWIDVKEEDKEIRKTLVSVIIDKPHRIQNGLNYPTWRRLRHQIEKMGIVATHLELKFENGNHFCYQLDEYKELYAEKGKGRPIYEEGYA